jgi:hypothetical protein
MIFYVDNTILELSGPSQYNEEEEDDDDEEEEDQDR